MHRHDKALGRDPSKDPLHWQMCGDPGLHHVQVLVHMLGQGQQLLRHQLLQHQRCLLVHQLHSVHLSEGLEALWFQALADTLHAQRILRPEAQIGHQQQQP